MRCWTKRLVLFFWWGLFISSTPSWRGRIYGRQAVLCVCDVEITWNWPELSAIRVLFAAIGKHDKETSLPTILRLIRTARPPADWWFPSAVRLSLLFSICTVRLLTVCWTHWLGYRACVFFFLLLFRHWKLPLLAKHKTEFGRFTTRTQNRLSINKTKRKENTE